MGKTGKKKIGHRKEIWLGVPHTVSVNLYLCQTYIKIESDPSPNELLYFSAFASIFILHLEFKFILFA